jgi:hypothetical protein
MLNDLCRQTGPSSDTGPLPRPCNRASETQRESNAGRTALNGPKRRNNRAPLGTTGAQG